MLKPWIADEGPRVPKDWGLAVFRGKTEPFFCAACKKHILYREQYLYNFASTGTIILHNKEECYKDALDSRRGNEDATGNKGPSSGSKSEL